MGLVGTQGSAPIDAGPAGLVQVPSLKEEVIGIDARDLDILAKIKPAPATEMADFKLFVLGLENMLRVFHEKHDPMHRPLVLFAGCCDLL